MAITHGRPGDSPLRSCAYCDEPLFGKPAKQRFCGHACWRAMQRLMQWADREPARRNVPWPQHYLDDWARQQKKWHEEGYPGNVARVTCGWHRREHRHE